MPSWLQMLESGLEKKAGTNYAPPANRQLIYFVDDLNLPCLDPYETAMVGGTGRTAGLVLWFCQLSRVGRDVEGCSRRLCLPVPHAPRFEQVPGCCIAHAPLAWVVPDSLPARLPACLHSQPISLMRQHLGYGHWYDRQKLTQKNISGTQ